MMKTPAVELRVSDPPFHRVGAGHSVNVVAGTRPEAVKVAPVVLALRNLGVETTLVDTGQQPGRVREALTPFGLAPDVSLDIVRREGGLAELTSLTVSAFDRHADRRAPDLVLVQGDTTTAFAVALAASLRKIPVAHLEAGLRTGDRSAPFPEEMNRALLADIAELHLAPSLRAVAALEREGVSRERIVLTGNTVVDALDVVLPNLRIQQRPLLAARPSGDRLLVVTVHRREAWGAGVESLCSAVALLLTHHPELRAVVVTHPNPVVAADVRRKFVDQARVQVVDPLPYEELLSLLLDCDVLLTDSGGLQEEAPSLGLRVLVARETTERPEGIYAGWARLVGLGRDSIVSAVEEDLKGRYPIPTLGNPYGDGKAADRVSEALLWQLGMRRRPTEWSGLTS